MYCHANESILEEIDANTHSCEKEFVQLSASAAFVFAPRAWWRQNEQVTA
jgi:hypothetical protein